MNSSSLIVGIVIQARMGSTRLPGKPLKKVLGKTLLEHLIERLQPLSQRVKIIIATTGLEKDKPIRDLCQKEKILYFEGLEEDVLSRTLFAARHFGIDVIIRITSDCPLMDPDIIERALDQFLSLYPKIDYYSNTITRTYPRGEDVEIFKRRDLEKAHEEAFLSYEREHVTPFIWKHPELFAIEQFKNEVDLSFHRWTVDTMEDFQLIEAIFEALYPKKPNFNQEDIVSFLKSRPDLLALNSHIQQKSVIDLLRN